MALLVDVLALADALADPAARGCIGMCRLPGIDPPSLFEDVAALALLQPSTVVTLLRADELDWLPGLTDDPRGFFPTMASAGFRHCHHPIDNGGVPYSLPEFAALIDALCSELRAGHTVILHCAAGRGRTGLAAAACLVRLGLAADQAIRTVRRVRPGTVENRSQEAYVRYFEAKIGAAPAT